MHKCKHTLKSFAAWGPCIHHLAGWKPVKILCSASIMESVDSTCWGCGMKKRFCGQVRGPVVVLIKTQRHWFLKLAVSLEPQLQVWCCCVTCEKWLTPFYPWEACLQQQSVRPWFDFCDILNCMCRSENLPGQLCDFLGNRVLRMSADFLHFLRKEG